MRKRLVGIIGAALLVAGVSAGCSSSGGDAPADPLEEVLGQDTGEDEDYDPFDDGVSLDEVALAVRDLDRAVAFYTGLGMAEESRAERDGATEAVLAFPDAHTRLALRQYADGRTQDIAAYPGKIVIAADDPTAFAATITANGGVVTLEPAPIAALQDTVVGLARDTEGYLLEINPSFDGSKIIAVGVGASDLAAAKEYYGAGLGMQVLHELTIPDLGLEEVILETAAGGGALVLMHYTDDSARSYQDNLVRLTFTAKDPAKALTDMTGAGGAAAETVVEGAEAAATDLDGNVLQVRRAS